MNQTCDVCGRPATVAQRDTFKWANLDEGCFEHEVIPGTVRYFCEEHNPWTWSKPLDNCGKIGYNESGE